MFGRPSGPRGIDRRCSRPILGLALPGMDGLTFRRALLVDPVLAEVPVVMYSGTDGVTVPGIVGHVARACGKPTVAKWTSHWGGRRVCRIAR